MSRIVAACAVVAACAMPAEARAQRVVETGDTARQADGPKPAARRLSATVAKFIEAQRPFEGPRPIDAKPFSGWSASVHGLRDSILVSIARTQIGTRYVFGGQSPDRGFDCSGLVRYVLGGFHIPLPRTAAEQALTGLSVGQDTNRLRPGDLLTFGKNKHGVSHVGIYLGNGRFVHASSVAGQVIESDLARPKSPRIKPWRDTRRVVSDADADDAAAGKGDS